MIRESLLIVHFLDKYSNISKNEPKTPYLMRSSLTIYAKLKLIFEYTSHQKVVLLQPFTPYLSLHQLFSIPLKTQGLSLFMVGEIIYTENKF